MIKIKIVSSNIFSSSNKFVDWSFAEFNSKLFQILEYFMILKMNKTTSSESLVTYQICTKKKWKIRNRKFIHFYISKKYNSLQLIDHSSVLQNWFEEKYRLDLISRYKDIQFQLHNGNIFWRYCYKMRTKKNYVFNSSTRTEGTILLNNNQILATREMHR